MKHRIYYSERERLYQVETKRLFVKWETHKFYLFTDSSGNVVRSKGFFTFEQADDWVNDRYPKSGYLKDIEKNKNIGFEF
jgi:hypothetical protein